MQCLCSCIKRAVTNAQGFRSAASVLHNFHRRLSSSLQLGLHCSVFHTLGRTVGNSLLTIETNTLDFFDFLLQQSSSIHQTKKIHAQIILTGHDHLGFLSAKLISVYSKFGVIDIARSIFSTASVSQSSCLLLWNSILRANLSHGYPLEALRLYCQMRKLGVAPDGFSFPLVIRAFASVGNPKLCFVVHGHAILMGYQSHIHVCNELIGMYGKIGLIDFARGTFNHMIRRNIVSWNIMVSGYAANYDCHGAFEMFNRMKMEEGLEPNVITWTSLLSAHARCGEDDEVVGFFMQMLQKGVGVGPEAIAVVLSVCSNSGFLDRGKKFHGYVVRSGFEEYVIVKNSLICMYGKHGHSADAKRLFSGMKSMNLVSWNALISSYVAAGLCDEALETLFQIEKVGAELMIRPNVVSWSAVIGGFASKGRSSKSLELFRQMQHDGVNPNSITIASVLSVCADLAALHLGKEIHGHLIRALMSESLLVGNGLLNLYCKCGHLRDGRLVFEHLKNRDLISWNSMIAGYGMHGFGEDALKTFEDMVKADFIPDGITFVALLSACSHTGLVAHGRRLFDQMINDYLLSPQMEHYACMVDLLGRAGLLEEASQLIKMMPMKPNACVWGALLNSCRIHKNMAVAEEIFNSYGFESEAVGSYMLLSNIYAAGGQWEDSAKIRVLTRTKGLKKSPGQSWIEVKKMLYTFSAGNPMQLHLEELYKVLEDLGQLMEANGYTPDSSFALHDVDEEEKKQILYGHSEKLAIAFGHMSIPLRMPIRVMKNLRVCGDCHNWTKFFSKMTGREVIVRDGHRFHHFADGICSCKDYW